jgi:uncharacterized protein
VAASFIGGWAYPKRCRETGQPAIIDCLEFNRDLRLRDPVDELTFLALEIHRLGSRRDISDIFMSEYRSTTSDHPPEELIRFYQSIRASIRARLALWHIRDTPAARPHWLARAAWYLDRAAGFAEVSAVLR